MDLKNPQNVFDAQGEEALQAHHQSDTPQQWGVVASISDLSVTNFREKIGGVEVVDAEFADRLLRVVAIMAVRHIRWRAAQKDHCAEGITPEGKKTAKYRLNKASKAYNRARNHAVSVILEASGSVVVASTEIPNGM